MGFSLQACKDAVCMEDDGRCRIFTARLSSCSPRLSVPAEGQIKYGSLACSHTNQFLCCLLDEVESDESTIAEQGRMSIAKCCDVVLSDALANGIEWLVLPAHVGVDYPSLPQLVQSARNATGQVQHQESELQLLLKVHALAAEQSKAGQGHVDWSTVALEARKSRCKQLDDLPSYLGYVQKWGGGESMEFVHALRDYFASHVPANRHVPADTFRALAALKMPADKLCPLFVTAVIKTQASCPMAKVVDRQCRYISAGDIGSLVKAKFFAMHEAEDLLRTCRQMLHGKLQSNPSPVASALVALLGKLDTSMVRVVLDKDCSSIKNLALHAPKGAAHLFVIELQGLLPRPPDVFSPWAADVAAVERAAAAAVSKSRAGSSTDRRPNVVQYKADAAVGAPQLLLASGGYQPGVFICDPNDGQVGEITKISEAGSVHVKFHSRTAVVPFAEAGTWILHKAPVILQVRRFPYHDVADFAEGAAKAACCAAFAWLSTRGMPNYQSMIECRSRPKKGVFENMSVKKLQLPLDTFKFACIEAGAAAPASSHLVGFEGVNVYACPPNGLPAGTAIAAWHVNTSAVEGESNMHVAYVSVKTKSGKKDGKGEVIELNIKVPILQSAAEIKGGEELVLFRPRVERQKEGGTVGFDRF
jgi:hypothetical protein